MSIFSFLKRGRESEEEAPTTAELWIVGRPDMTRPGAWELLGVFSSHDLAAARCGEFSDFIAPVTLDILIPDDASRIERPMAGKDST